MKPLRWLVPEGVDPSLKFDRRLSITNLLARVRLPAKLELRYVLTDVDRLANSIETPSLYHWEAWTVTRL